MSGRSGLLVPAVVTAAVVLAGCGGGDRPAAAGSPTASASSGSATPSPSASPTPEALASPDDLRTTTTSSRAAVPSGGPTEAGEFPVPPGYRVKGPAPQARSWQFDITTNDTAAVLAFYRTALAAQGYRVANDVTTKVGDETVHYDIAFRGPSRYPVTGYVVADPGDDDVFVLVQSLPEGR